MAVTYCCINCKKSLENHDNYYLCPECGYKYRKFAGVPNFKQKELYPGEENVLENIAKQYDKLTFEELLEYADSHQDKNSLPWEFRRASRFTSKTAAEQKEFLANYSKNTIIKSGREQIHVTNTLLSHADTTLEYKTCLDIGCGRGPWVVMASSAYKHIHALDVDMASVIIAKKYCDTQGIKNITFLSASASELPFPDNSFDLINSQAVLEHVDIQLKSLREVRRTLAPGGYFTGDSVNRYNLVTPEPHVEIRLLGFMPKSWAHKLSLALKNFPYDDLKPLSYAQLDTMLKQSFGTKYKIVPFVETLQQSLTQSATKVMPPCFKKHFNHTHYILGSK